MKYKGYTYLLFAMLLHVVLCTSCQEDDFKGNAEQTDPMEFSAAVVQQYDTRAGDNGFADGDRIGVFVVNYKDGNSQPLALTGNHADNVMFTYDGTNNKWTGAYQIYWKDKKTAIDAYGYHPFDNELSSVTAYPFNIHHNQRDEVGNSSITGYEASDFLWAKAEGVVPTTAPLILQHKHIMAGIEVKLVEGVGFMEGEWTNLDKQVVIENTRLEATINLQSGVVNVDKNSTAQGIIPQKYGNDFRAILIPQSVAAGETLLSIAVGSQTHKFTRKDDMIYNPQKLHKFTIQVNYIQSSGDYEFKLLQENVIAWQGDKLSHNGKAREYITVHVNEGEYIGDVIKRMGIDPGEILNLKLTGMLTKHNHFRYIRENMPQLEAVNMRELRTKKQEMFYKYEVETIIYDDGLPFEAFNDMRFLQVVIWPENLKAIGDEAFAGCNLRGSLIFPEGIKHIGEACFSAYGKQPNAFTGEIYIPSSVEYLGSGAFGDLRFQGEVVLPTKMKFLGDGAFSGCNFITGKIVIPDGLTEIHKAWAPNMNGDVVIPQGVKKIHGIGGKITSLYIPEGVEEIGEKAFRDVSTLDRKSTRLNSSHAT